MLGILGLVVGLLLCEIGLRLLGFRQPELLDADACLHHHNLGGPGSSFMYRGHLEGSFTDFANPVTLNQAGFHDVEHADRRTDPRTFRLMVVGDSYVAALSVPLEKTFFRKLEARLLQEDPLHCGSYEVIAMGQGNQGQQKELEYVRTAGPRYQPDAVLLLFFCGNDIMENGPATFKAAAAFGMYYKHVVAPAKAACFRRWLWFPHSRVNGLLAEAATTFYALHLDWFRNDIHPADLVSPELGVYRTPLSPEWQSAYVHTGWLLYELKAETRALGARFLVAGLEGPQAIGDVGPRLFLGGGSRGLSLGQPSEWLAAWCASNAVPYCPLASALTGLGRRAYWPHDGHLNIAGNEAIVAPLYRFVVEEAHRPAAYDDTGGHPDGVGFRSSDAWDPVVQ
jgi:hypothetical protein